MWCEGVARRGVLRLWYNEVLKGGGVLRLWYDGMLPRVERDEYGSQESIWRRRVVVLVLSAHYSSDWSLAFLEASTYTWIASPPSPRSLRSRHPNKSKETPPWWITRSLFTQISNSSSGFPYLESSHVHSCIFLGHVVSMHSAHCLTSYLSLSCAGLWPDSLSRLIAAWLMPNSLISSLSCIGCYLTPQLGLCSLSLVPNPLSPAY